MKKQKQKQRREAAAGTISPGRLNLAVCLFLVVSVLAVFWQVRGHEFLTYDDPDYVTKNPHIRDGISPQAVLWALTSGYAANWHPLTWISHMIDVQLYGMDPGGHHLTSVWIHAASALLLFLTLKRMTRRLWPSAFVAALFALHPLHAESVSWIAERKDVLSGFFWILTMWCYAAHAEKRSTGTYLALLLSFAVGLMAKQMLVTLPFVLLLLDYWPLNRLRLPGAPVGPAKDSQAREGTGGGSSAGRVIREKIPLIALTVISSVTIYLVQQGGGAMSTRDLLPLGARVSNAIVSYMVYIEKTIWPSGLAIFYPHPGSTLTLWTTGVSALILLVVTGFVLFKGRRYPYLPVGWFWYLGTLVPVIGLVQVGIQARADRYTYLPIIGLFIMVAWGLPDLLSGWRNRKELLAGGVLAALASCIYLTATQTAYWRDNSSVFGHAVEVVENNFLAHNDLGSALEKKGEIDAAIAHYREAIRLKPDFVLAQSNLGAALGRQGKFDEAISHLQEAIRLKPDHAGAHNNLGIVYAIKGKDSDAAREFSEAVRIDPDQADAHFNLGVLLARQGRLDEAITHYERALEINPSQENARNALSEARTLQTKKR